MADLDRGRHGLSFGAAADAYERARPGYPLEAVRALLGATPLEVLDVGAGTGKLTRTLVEAGHRVIAVDPLPEMLARLATALPDVTSSLGTAEQLPLPDASVDAVVAGQAFHWFDPPLALPEIARVLRPQGVLGLCWNVRDDSVPWVAAYDQLVQAEPAVPRPDLGAHFTCAALHEHRHVVSLTPDDLIALAESRSYVIMLTPEQRERVLAAVAGLGRREAVDGVLRLPYRLNIWSAQLR